MSINNVYGHSMSKPLPYKNSKWSDDLTCVIYLKLIT